MRHFGRNFYFQIQLIGCYYTERYFVFTIVAMVETAPGTLWANRSYVINSHYAERHFKVFCFKIYCGSWNQNQ
jgi:hypothetical protein